MNFTEIKAAVRDLVARTDYTDTKAGEHVNRAIDRLSRVQGLPSMERAVEVTLGASPIIEIPEDYLFIKHLIFGDRELQKLEYPTLLKMEAAGVQPYYYSRIQSQWEVRPAAEGLVGTLIYVAVWPNLVNGTDTNELLVSGPEAILYQAASYACTYFRDTRLEEFERRFKAIAEEMTGQAMRAELSSPTGMTLQTPYDGMEY